MDSPSDTKESQITSVGNDAMPTISRPVMLSRSTLSTDPRNSNGAAQSNGNRKYGLNPVSKADAASERAANQNQIANVAARTPENRATRMVTASTPSARAARNADG